MFRLLLASLAVCMASSLPGKVCKLLQDMNDPISNCAAIRLVNAIDDITAGMTQLDFKARDDVACIIAKALGATDAFTDAIPDQTPMVPPGGSKNAVELTLANQNVTDGGAKAIARALALASSSLNTVDLSSNGITSVGATAIIKAILANKASRVVELNLSGACHG